LPRIWTVPVGPVERTSSTTVPVNGAITCQLVRFKVQPRARPSVSAKELLISVGPLVDGRGLFSGVADGEGEHDLGEALKRARKPTQKTIR
jgi:hypothetical protein